MAENNVETPKPDGKVAIQGRLYFAIVEARKAIQQAIEDVNGAWDYRREKDGSPAECLMDALASLRSAESSLDDESIVAALRCHS